MTLRLLTAWPYLKASNTGEGDNFGYSVGLSSDGETLAVGSPYEDSNATGVHGDQGSQDSLDSGAVYVFTWANGGWSQQAYLKSSNTGGTDEFGISVALSSNGNTLAVGSWQEDSNATGIGGQQQSDDAVDSGAVYVFNRTGGVWSQQAYIKASNTGSGDHFGLRVALSSDGDTLAVGANKESSNARGVNGADNQGAASSGAVYVFNRTGIVWSQQAYVKASNTGANVDFGLPRVWL